MNVPVELISLFFESSLFSPDDFSANRAGSMAGESHKMSEFIPIIHQLIY